MKGINSYCYDSKHFMIKKEPFNHNDSNSAAAVAGKIPIDLRENEFSPHCLSLNNTVGLNMTVPLTLCLTKTNVFKAIIHL